MYLDEVRFNWRPLLAASLGISLGSSVNYYTMSLFGPPLIAEFGWSKAQFALLGSLPLFTLFLVPFAGRFTDRFGARMAAIIGFIAVPVGFAAFSLMTGPISQFFAIYVVQHIFGILTTSLVFARVVVERFDAARGIALSVLMTGPPLGGAILAPVLGDIIHDHGWRTGFLVLAAISAAGGAGAIFLMGRGGRKAGPARDDVRLGGKELLGLLRHPALLLILGGMFLVNLPQVFASSQLKLALLDLGATDMTATWMLSLYAMGVIAGRFVTGLALDRIKPHVVALVALSLPALGFLAIASSANVLWILIGAVLVVGLAQGAEGDIGAYLISRRFGMKNYSLLLSCVTMAIAGGSAVGALILSFTLTRSTSYTPFLIVAALTTLIGAGLFGLLGRERPDSRSQPDDAALPPEPALAEVAGD